MSSLTIDPSQPITIYSRPSYKEFFDRYQPESHGAALVATYSFNHWNFDFWSKLEPFSKFYLADMPAKRAAASDFAKRFPLFQVNLIPKLHRKVVYFPKCGVLYLGSENLYTPNAEFWDFMIEMTIPENRRTEVATLLFGDLKGEQVVPRFELRDIYVHGHARYKGYAYLPCQTEIPYWDRICKIVDLNFRPPEPEFQHFGRIYVINEYDVRGESKFVCFGRGYDYCGDLSSEAAHWLLENFEITQEHIGFQTTWSQENSHLKDRIFDIHPLLKEHAPVRGYWISRVKDIDQHSNRVREIAPREITNLKIQGAS